MKSAGNREEQHRLSSSQRMRAASRSEKIEKLSPEQLVKKLRETFNELDDLKMKFGSLKRNYESVANYAAKDNIESKKFKEVTDALKRSNEELLRNN